MQNATFSLIGIAFAWLLLMTMVTILLLVQYLHNDFMHLLTYSMMKVFVSWAFLKSFTKIPYKKGSIDFLKASHISAKVIMPFLARLERRDSTSLSTYGMIPGKFCWMSGNMSSWFLMSLRSPSKLSNCLLQSLSLGRLAVISLSISFGLLTGASSSLETYWVAL